jgi:hypothetical protein
VSKEYVFEYGHGGRGVLPRAVLFQVMPEGSGRRAELAIDNDPMPLHVHLSAPGFEHLEPLLPTESGNGMLAYAAFSIPVLDDLRVEVLGEGGNPIPELSFLASFTTGRALRIRMEQPSTDPGMNTRPSAPRRDEYEPAPDVLSLSTPGTIPVAALSNPAAEWRPPVEAGHVPIQVSSIPFDPPARKLATHKRGTEWPKRLGEAGRGLGPTAPSGALVLTLTGIERTDAGVRVEVLLEDEGQVATVQIARLGEALASVTPPRLTAVSPSNVSLTVPDAGGPLVLIARDAYGEAFADLIAGLDVDRGAFVPFEPVPAIWKRFLGLRGPIDMKRSLCASCRTELDLGTATSWTRIESHEREALRAQFPLTPEALGLCAACHEEHVLSGHLTHAILKYVNVARFREVMLRLAFAYVGALAIRTGAGALFGRFLDVGFQGGIDDWLSFDVAAAFFAFLLAVLPWPSMLRQIGAGWRALLFRREIPNAVALVTPAMLGGAIWLGYNDPAELPALYVQQFWTVHLTVSAIAGASFAMVAVLLFEALVERAAKQRLGAHRRQLEAGKAGLLTPPLLSVTTQSEYVKALERALVEGLGALEFQTFARPPQEEDFHLIRSVGPFRSSTMNLRFTEDHRSVLGRCAALGHPIAATDLGKDQLIDPAELDFKVPFRLCIPIWANGRVAEIHCVSRLRATADLGEALRLCELIALAAGRCLHRLLKETADPGAVTAH